MVLDEAKTVDTIAIAIRPRNARETVLFIDEEFSEPVLC
jgi:hypothetical protein